MYNNSDAHNFIHQLSIDCVIFGYRDRQLKVLVSKLNFEGEFYTLPGGFILHNEDIDLAARRILNERTALSDLYLQQFYVFGQAGRNNKEVLDQLIKLNPKMQLEEIASKKSYDWLTKRFISVGYYALVDITKFTPRKTALDESIAWYDISSLPPLIMDHREIVEKALETLRREMDEKITAFNLLPDTFTMKEVQKLYETVHDRPFVRTNFQKKILDLQVLERIGKKYTGAANKAPYLYRFKNAHFKAH